MSRARVSGTSWLLFSTTTARSLGAGVLLLALLVTAASCGQVITDPGKTGGAGGGAGGGSGGGGECDPAACPAPADACSEAACTALGACAEEPKPDGTLAAQQAAGDCKKKVCKAGKSEDQDDDTDLPDDGNECTEDACKGGAPSNLPEAKGSPCGSGGAFVCDGAGTCNECNDPIQCPGEDTECQTRTCAAGACALSFAPSGTLLASQTQGDCKVLQCNGKGGAEIAIDDLDVSDDGNACTIDACGIGGPTHTPAILNTPCGVNLKCDGAGSCVGCVTPADCGAPTVDCQVATCDAGTCGIGNKLDGASCDDGDACTKTDACQAGACAGGNPVLCSGGATCEAGACVAAACAGLIGLPGAAALARGRGSGDRWRSERRRHHRSRRLGVAGPSGPGRRPLRGAGELFRRKRLDPPWPRRI